MVAVESDDDNGGGARGAAYDALSMLVGQSLREGEYGERAGIPWVVYADGAPLAIADPYHHPHFVPTLDHNSHFKSASLLALPLRGADGETLGVLELLNKWPDAAAAAPAADERRPSVDVALHARPLYTDEDAELLAVLSEKCCAAIEATRLREQSDANFFQALQSHEKKGSVGAKLDELKAMLPTGVDASQAAALISSLKAELARE